MINVKTEHCCKNIYYISMNEYPDINIEFDNKEEAEKL